MTVSAASLFDIIKQSPYPPRASTTLRQEPESFACSFSDRLLAILHI
jgi:hypothetical protein